MFYNICVADTPRFGGKVVKSMFNFIISFLAAVGAEVAANFLYDYISKWLNSRKK
ncbi:MAG: hypothetical protein K2G04_03170 [Oscillospiraceae bacterium]|nr:hypothetical protein [Oscillospiraceae bacterium]